jgi:TetR/AcrR family transcriptional regulator, tetracycline repressor protein
MEAPTAAPRGRGRPRRVSRESIIDAARAMVPELLSMQSVADQLGVDRSTINYHFADREELFAVVAASAFGAEMAQYRAPESDRWQEWVAHYSRAVHAALLRHPEFAGYVRLASGTDSAAFAAVEGLISKLASAGFGERDVVQSVAYISEVVHAAARNEILARSGGHPQGAELEQFLSLQPEESVPGLRRLLELDPYEYEEHFEFAVRMIVAGLESLPRRRPPAA